jgi:hypothetical protein
MCGVWLRVTRALSIDQCDDVILSAAKDLPYDVDVILSEAKGLPYAAGSVR